jgi:Ca2+-transporting ATPase
MRLPLPADRLTVALSNPEGLSTQSVGVQRERYGDNLIIESRRRSWKQRIKETAADPMLWFLLVTSFVYFVLGDTTEAVVLLLAVLPLTGMDAFLHHRTQASTAGLESRLAAHANVMRDGREQRVTAQEVVVGDLVLLRAGELVAADGVLREAAGLQVEESSLTGEAYPVRKAPLMALPTGAEATLVEGRHWGFAGTRVLSGEGLLCVVNTGKDTLYGQIVRTASVGSARATPLQAAINQLVAVLSVAAVALCVLLALVRVTQGHGWLDALVSAATLAVAALPEEFPVAFTFFLGAGVYRLARRHALVRRAVSVENIGRVTAICADKTGTLTQGTLSVTVLLPATGYTREQLLATAAGASRTEGMDPLDVAILAAGERAGVGPPPGERIAVFPFTEERRRETGVWADPVRCMVATKGTPELILGLCKMTEEGRRAWLERVGAVAAEGRKPIACARATFDRTEWRGGEPTDGFEFAGLVICEDPLRPGVQEAIRACQDAGIHPIMITGDHPNTALAVARSIGLGGAAPRVVLGDELPAALESRDGVESIDVVARALPAQKLSLVRALQAHGHNVAATGDGVNDVPALQAADVGIAMGERGTQSAREVASVVLLDDNFRTIVGAIAEGRQLFENLRASFQYLLFVHIPLVFTAAFVPLAGYPLLYLPIHIVWLELIIHPTALLSFQSSRANDDLVRLPHLGRARFFSLRDWLVLMASGAITTVAVAGGYLHSLGESGNEAHGRAMALVVLTTASASAAAILNRLRGRAAKIVAVATLGTTLVLVQVPPLAALLRLEPLHADDLLRAAVASAAACAPMLLDGALRRRGRRS